MQNRGIRILMFLCFFAWVLELGLIGCGGNGVLCVLSLVLRDSIGIG